MGVTWPWSCVASSFVCPRAPLLGERWGYTQGWTDRSPPINWAELEHEAGPPRNCAAALTHTPGGEQGRRWACSNTDHAAERTHGGGHSAGQARSAHSRVGVHETRVSRDLCTRETARVSSAHHQPCAHKQTWHIAHTCSGQAPAMPPRGYTLLHYCKVDRSILKSWASAIWSPSGGFSYST